jgi:regulator of protease activity HflC (stomatin/prohibitin superfamily)
MDDINVKKILKWVGIGLGSLVVLIMFFSSWSDVQPGEEGFIYRPYSGGVDEAQVYSEGTQFIAPWNEMITYDMRRKSRSYTSKVMDVNGTDITVKVSVNYQPKQGTAASLHLDFGPIVTDEETGKISGGYVDMIDDKVKGSIKDVIGRYTYEEVYSTKREALEGEIEDILKKDFKDNYITLHYIEIADVDLPSNIAKQITEKETQKQRNLTAKEKQKEQEYLANARIEKSRGDSALVISARYKAEAIELEAEQIAKNPQYIELKKWENWDGKGSPFGSGNVFGNSSISILKSNR